MTKQANLAEWFKSTCGGIIMMYIGGPNEGKQLFLRDDQRFKQILAILEAAGDFTADDKERIGNALDNIPFYVPLSGYKCPGQVLRDKFKTFLSSLPDPTVSEEKR